MKKTRYIRIDPLFPDEEAIKEAALVIKNGGLVALPTETVYGLAANGFMPGAVADVFAAKGRPQDNPLILHIAEMSWLESVATDIPDTAYRLFEKFSPGPLTLVLRRKQKVPPVVSAGLDTVAVRIPAHPIALGVIKAAGVPVAAPSANISGRPSPTSFEHIKDELFGRADLIIDGGDCPVGVESTVLSLAGEIPVLLRPGGVSVEELENEIGGIALSSAVLGGFEGAPSAPGMKYRHYAPRARLVVVAGEDERAIEYINGELATAKEGDAGVLCFEGEEVLFEGAIAFSYGKREDVKSQAHGLFGALYRFDGTGVRVIYARSGEKTGIGLAVYNRLIKAAGYETVEV